MFDCLAKTGGNDRQNKVARYVEFPFPSHSRLSLFACVSFSSLRPPGRRRRRPTLVPREVDNLYTHHPYETSAAGETQPALQTTSRAAVFSLNMPAGNDMADNPVTGDDVNYEAEAQLMLGPSIFGWCLQLILCGLSIMLVWQWFNARKGESRRIKAMVGVALGFNLMSAGLCFARVYRFATYADQSSTSAYQNTPICLEPLCIGAVALITQGYLGCRTCVVRFALLCKGSVKRLLQLVHHNRIFGIVCAIMLASTAGTTIALVALECAVLSLALSEPD
jgi:hypothetical protein